MHNGYVKQELIKVNQPTIEAIDELIRSTTSAARSINLGVDEPLQLDTNCVRVIMPDSKGLLISSNNVEFLVQRVFLTPEGLRYEGITLNMKTITTATLLPPIEHVVEIPGESRIGLYNFQTGRIDEIKVGIAERKSLTISDRTFDTEKLRSVLLSYFTDGDMNELCSVIGINSQILGVGNKFEKVNNLVSYAEKNGYSIWLLQEAFNLYKNRQTLKKTH